MDGEIGSCIKILSKNLVLGKHFRLDVFKDGQVVVGFGFETIVATTAQETADRFSKTAGFRRSERDALCGQLLADDEHGHATRECKTLLSTNSMSDSSAVSLRIGHLAAVLRQHVGCGATVVFGRQMTRLMQDGEGACVTRAKVNRNASLKVVGFFF